MKIFVVGGHKNGTMCLYNWFLEKGLRSIGQQWSSKPDLIKKNDCFLDHFGEFGDSENKVINLLNLYPDSVFILNYRNLEDYINSLVKHLLNGEYKKKPWSWKNYGKSVSERILNTNKTNFVVRFFKNNNLLNKLLVINICDGNNIENTRILENFSIFHTIQI